MKKDLDSPQYSDVLIFTCFIYPLLSAIIGFITQGIEIPGTLLFCFFVCLPIASLVFVCIRKIMKRAYACIVSTFIGLMTVYFLLIIVASGLLGFSVGMLGKVMLILCMPYIISCGIYLVLLRCLKSDT